MPLAAGTRLGVYEILSLIGAGGMGEVYRARDSKLGRDVALKILPDVFAYDPDRQARFQREAQVLASLNHPHIAGIYGFEDAPSPAEGQPPMRAIALELVEGQTLESRIAQGALSLNEALPIAVQIADALDAAHTQGIIHRDLKPANIKLRADGAVKVLDFGLAKSVEASGDQEHSPTITAISRHGVILGTAGYMSPEQARGKPVDKRCDIWAFGCVLYEMLTGASPFAGDTVTDTLSAIVSREPDWTRLPSTAPPELRRLLLQMLEKDPKRRLRDIGDAQLGLQAGSARSEMVASPQHASRLGWQIAAAGAMVAAVVFGIVAWWRPPVSSISEPVRRLTRITSDNGFTTEPSVSADGRLVAYASDRAQPGNLDIWIQQTAGAGAVRLTSDPTDDREPHISPDGTRVAFRSDRGKGGIYVLPALGGDARLIAPEGRAPRFSPDGRSIAYWTGEWLAARAVRAVRRTFVTDANGGTPRQVAEEFPSVGDPVWSPDGRSLLVLGRRSVSAQEGDPANWWLVPLNGGSPLQTNAYELFSAAGIEIETPVSLPYPREWTASGVVFTATTRADDITGLWRADLDARSGKVTALRQITTGTTSDEWPASSGDGSLVFAGLTKRRVVLALPLDANSGSPRGPIATIRRDVARIERTTVSQDGTRIAFSKFDAGAASVWVHDVPSGQARQIAATKRTPLNPVISGDGRWIAYTVSTVDQGGGTGPGPGFVIPAEGGSPRQICDACQLYQWLRDRRVVALDALRETVTLIDADGRHEPEMLLRTSRKQAPTSEGREPAPDGRFTRPLVSPDERFVAFMRRNQLHVAPWSGVGAIPPERWVPFWTGVQPQGRLCGWSPDSRLLYVLLELDGFRCLYAVHVDAASGRAVGEPFLVQHLHDASRQWGSTGYSSAVVNGVFIFNLVETAGNIWLLR